MTSDLEKLSKQLQAAIERKPRKPKLGPLQQEIAALFCSTCGDFMSSSGCPEHPQQQPLL